jgi:hypothetical protein
MEVACVALVVASPQSLRRDYVQCGRFVPRVGISVAREGNQRIERVHKFLDSVVLDQRMAGDGIRRVQVMQGGNSLRTEAQTYSESKPTGSSTAALVVITESRVFPTSWTSIVISPILFS